MALTAPATPADPEVSRAPLHRREQRWLHRPEVRVCAAASAVAIVLTLAAHAHHLQALPDLVRGSAASLILFAVCGDALALLLAGTSWGALRPLLALPLGIAASSLALTALGLLHVPLTVSLWVVLGAGVCASVLVRRRLPRHRRASIDRVELACWVAVLFIVFCVAQIPAWRLGYDTIYGTNPDAHQVAGIAVLFQHVPPTGTDTALPIDTVPWPWRFRYPIFYPLAAASNLSHFDPIRVFPAMAALLMVSLALGFGALAVRFLRLPTAGGMVVAGVLGLWPVLLYLGWMPYWNQLWGLAMLPYAIMFGWQALAAGEGRAAVLCALALVTLALGYPLALPYPLLILAALVVAYWRRPRLPRISTVPGLLLAVLGALVLLPALAGAGLKLEQGLSQLLSSHSALWGGAIKHPLPIGFFAGTGGGIVPALIVLAVAAGGLALLPRRPRWMLGLALGILCLLDLRFRLDPSGAYMDFKHLSFVGTLVVTLAAAAAARLVLSRSRAALAAGATLLLAWSAAAVVQDRNQGISPGEQVAPQMFQIRQWASRLPAGASVRVDIPASGTQLWAVYMLASHPVDALDPVKHTTYAHAPYGQRADYSLSLRYYPNPAIRKPFPVLKFASDPPLFENSEFVLRRIRWPARLTGYPDTASRRLVGP